MLSRLGHLNEDKDIFVSKMEGYENKVGLRKTEFLSSSEGIPIYKDHDYELVSIYNNTSGTEQDAMALIYMYVADHGFIMRR